jgi:hypothetical protein
MKGWLWGCTSFIMGAQLDNLEWACLLRTLRDGCKGFWWWGVSLSLKMGWIRCCETSVMHNHCVLRTLGEEHRSSSTCILVQNTIGWSGVFCFFCVSDNTVVCRANPTIETSAHILCWCEVLALLRHAYLGCFFLEPEIIKNVILGPSGTLAKWQGSHKLQWGTYGLLIKA